MSFAGRKKLIRLPEAAIFLDTSVSNLYALVKRGEVPAIKMGQQWRFNIDELEAYSRGMVTSSATNKSQTEINNAEQIQAGNA